MTVVGPSSLAKFTISLEPIFHSKKYATKQKTWCIYITNPVHLCKVFHFSPGLFFIAYSLCISMYSIHLCTVTYSSFELRFGPSSIALVNSGWGSLLSSSETLHHVELLFLSTYSNRSASRVLAWGGGSRGCTRFTHCGRGCHLPERTPVLSLWVRESKYQNCDEKSNSEVSTA